MTCRSERRRRGRRAHAAGAAGLAVVAVAFAVAGCGEPAAERLGPREAATAWLQRLAGGDVAGVCRSLTPRAVAELARDFGGTDCTQTSTRAARYVVGRKGMREAVRGVEILPTLDVPLSPAPQRAGATTAALRLVIDDPVLGTRQAFDVGLRRIGGRWRVDRGVSALFTLVRGS